MPAVANVTYALLHDAWSALGGGTYFLARVADSPAFAGEVKRLEDPLPPRYRRRIP